MWIVSSSVYGSFDEWRYAQTKDFDAARWKAADLKYRYSVLEEVVGSRIKKGMTESELVDLLGTPDVKRPDGSWQYETERPGSRLIDFSGGGVVVTFSSDRRVSAAEDNRWID
jgi:hypothetical protein